MALGMTVVTSCTTTQRPSANAEPKFHEAKNADLVVRYYSENISRVMKPLQMEGPFLTSFDRGTVLELAKQQAGRDLAVVVLLQFNSSDRVKRSWLTPLTGMGYKRVVFLRAEEGGKVDGLSIMANPGEPANQPEVTSGPEHPDTAGG